MPLEWIDYRDAVRLYHTEQVAYTCGIRLYRLFGGTNARSGLQTVVEVNSISQLSRDHIRPLSQCGRDTWMNVVTACRRCNNLKASKTPEQAGLQLIAVPFKPTYAEYIYLKGRRVLADQMEYLLAHFPRTSPLHARLKARAVQ
jgi:HNH endonuclease